MLITTDIIFLNWAFVGITGSSRDEDRRTHWGYVLKQVLTLPCRLWKTLHSHWAELSGELGGGWRELSQREGAEGSWEGLGELWWEGGGMGE